MVFLTNVCLKAFRRKNQQKKFLEYLRVYVKGGAGGQGYPKYGGRGGKGGDVYIVANETRTMYEVRSQNPQKRYIASIGGNSMKDALLGKNGENVEIQVPVGVCVKNDLGYVLADLDNPEDRVLVARGGDGGRPDNGYQVEKGEVQMIRLDYKLIADVGFVGFPNAGKSTLLKAVSRTQPKIAAYPFTTIQPQIGTMMFSDTRQISVADLPGLIEGAHLNRGMGHRFLKHLERTKMLLFVVDLHGFQLDNKSKFRSAVETILLLNKELELYKVALVDKPAVLALNKIDIEGATTEVDKIVDQLENFEAISSAMDEIFQPETLIKFDAVIPISAKYNQDVDILRQTIRDLLDQYANMQREEAEEKIEKHLESQKPKTDEQEGFLV